MSKVFVLDTHKRPLNPVHPGRARLLLTQGKAAVFRHYPFTLILKEEVHQPEIEQQECGFSCGRASHVADVPAVICHSIPWEV